MRILYPVVLLLVCVLAGCGKRAEYDIVIRNGLIYDGSGQEPFVADLGIKGDRIAAIGKALGPGTLTVDAKGLYVAPGFIDLHNHAEFPVDAPERYSVLNYLRQGVSTVVTGPDGAGEYQVADYFARLQRHGIGPNVMHTVGHNFIREDAMGGSFDRAPTAQEMQRMQAMVRQAMQEGAVGLSSGLYYTPGTYATTEEVIELARVAGESGGIYTSHIRDEGDFLYDDPNKDGLLDAVREAIRIGKEAGVVANITHIKAEGILGASHWGKSLPVTQLIEQARVQGQRVYADQYPYTASSTSLSAVTVPRWVQADELMSQRLRDPSLRARIVNEMRLTVEGGLGPQVMVISRFEQRPDWEGKNLAEVAGV
ncbi:N-acyl-D-amino-acid deacylase family protein, partial [Steroidobacter sp.]|uniref:N-acyl-D-amino-acid deacylase family protein n=1 Tax=Steroidobacter sp. TaxID=1978227 RepID=UPI001A3D1A92